MAGSELRPEPPGQGQVLVVLRGRAEVGEIGGSEGRVISTTRIERQVVLDRGHVFRVANDARWTLVSHEEDTLLVSISTSVPREAHRSEDLLALARRRKHMGPCRFFGNEVVKLDFVAARGRLPFRAWVPWSHRADGVEIALILEGCFRASLQSSEHEKREFVLPAGSMLRIPAGLQHRFRAGESRFSVGLVVSGRASVSGERVSRNDAQGFSPFSV
ncbi:MAG: cupin domain-containing protein [Myxococcota bacterium]|nr:cupin domain-containing protein [Myxococcota bacterium]